MGGLVGTLFFLFVPNRTKSLLLRDHPGEEKQHHGFGFLMWTLGTRLELRENPNLQKPNKFYNTQKFKKVYPAGKTSKTTTEKIERIFGFPRGPRPGWGGEGKQESSGRLV
jgi:hypothetical protein